MKEDEMATLSTLIDSRLAGLSGRLALEWPGGRAGPLAAGVRLKLRSRQMLAGLARGQIGSLASAYVRGDLEIEGSLSDVMAVAGELAGDPVGRGRRGAWGRWV